MRRTILVAMGFLFLIPIGLYAQNRSVPPATLIGPGVRVNVENGHGSGVHIGGGYVVTAAHVVGDAKRVEIVTEGGEILSADVLWSSKEYDIALVVQPLLTIASAPLSCEDPAVGTLIQTTGNPLNLDFIRTWGRVSSNVATRGDWRRSYIADVTIAAGVSGGPVYDMQQRVVGIVVAVALQPMGFGGSVIPLAYIAPASAVCHLMARS